MNRYLMKLKNKPEMLRMKLAAKRGVPVPFEFRGRRYFLNADDSAIFHIQNSTQKIANMTDLIPPQARVIFDVGGNCGLFSAFAEVACPNAVIHCFEPSSKLLPIIQRNVSQNRVHVHGVAISDSNGKAELHINPGSEQTNSLNRSAVELFAASANIKAETIDCICLDDFSRNNNIDKVDVLKVDVQGFEGAVLRGGRGLLQTVDMLFIESTWMDIESIVELIPFALHYGFSHASVLNSVYMGADILLSRRKIAAESIKMEFLINEQLLTRRWI